MTTKLEAVNLMLAAIGEAPVNSLASGLPDAEAAETLLDEVKKQVLSKGWQVNTRGRKYPVVLEPNSSGEILTPATMISIDTTGPSAYVSVSRRGGYLWDDRNETKVWPTGTKLSCQIIYNLAFEDLNFELQQYIALRAARRFAKREIGSVTLDGLTKEDEDMAYADALSADSEGEDFNMINDNPHSVARRWSNRLRA